MALGRLFEPSFPHLCFCLLVLFFVVFVFVVFFFLETTMPVGGVSEITDVKSRLQ